MKKSERVIRAAERLFYMYNILSCVALFQSGVNYHHYAALFSPKKRRPKHSSWLAGEFDTLKKAREWRVTALCLYAAMLESEGE